MGYALKEMGVFNHGEATLTDIFDCFEEAFHVDPGNTSRLFQDITRREIRRHAIPGPYEN